jgi:hypothetical protein
LRPRNILILVAVLAIALTVYFVTQPAEEPTTEIEPAEYVWQFEMDELEYIEIELPGQEMSESFLKHEDRQWYFYPDGSEVSSYRWSGGIPAILAGPETERSIAKNATEEQLDAYGFTSPLMKITLATENDEVANIVVGSAVPDGSAYYIRLAESNDVYIIHVEWYDVIERLVTDPPYVTEDEE